MQTKTRANKTANIIPQPGSEETFIDRLIDYVSYYDPDWKGSLVPASDEQIQRYKEFSEIESTGKDIPATHLAYLKRMGQDDGGLLTKLGAGGFYDIDYLIGFYHADPKLWPNWEDPTHLVIFNSYMGIPLSIALLENDLIIDGDDEENYKYYAENFEKMVFQHAFHQLGRCEYNISIASSKNSVNEAKEAYQVTNILDHLTRVVEAEGLAKAWFSDETHFIAISDRINVSVRNTSGAVVGFISGLDREEVERKGSLFIENMGAIMDEKSWEK